MTLDDPRPFPLNPHYRVYRDGRIESCLTPGRRGGPSDQWRLIRPGVNDSGYPYFSPKVDGRHKEVTVHKAVLLTWIGPCPPGMLCRHLDGDKLNCHLDNLRWGTPQENADDARHLGELTLGEARSNAKLTDLERQMVVTGKLTGLSLADMAEHFGVTRPTLHYVCYGRRGRPGPLSRAG